MSDDKPPSASRYSSNGNAEKKSWFSKFTQLFQESPQDREELVEVLKSAEKNTLINPELLSMMEGVMHISELHARDIMIARPQMVVVNDEMGFSEMLSSIVESGHSRFPVIGDNRDDIEGIVLAKDLLHFTALNANGDNLKFEIKDFLRPAAIIPESKRLDTLLKEFRTNRSHMAIVVDEYGSVAGLVTIEDVLEQIVGDIEDEFDIDGDEETIQKLSEVEFIVKGHTEIEEFNEFFKGTLDEDEFDTVGGVLTHALGHVPTKGEAVELDGFRFEVINADTRRLKLVRVFRLSQS
jgi:magnesium and cobalt transporter